MLALCMLIIACTGLYAIYRFTIRHTVVVDRMFPGPMSWPLVGNAWVLWDTREEIYRKIMDWSFYYEYQNIRFWLFNKPFIGIMDPQLAKTLLMDPRAEVKADEYQYFIPWLGSGLFTAKAEIWRKNRKLLTPAFHFKILVDFIDIFEENANILCDNLSSRADGEVFDLYDYIALYALDNICDTALGTKIHAQINTLSEYVMAVKNLTEIIFTRWISPLHRYDWIFDLTSLGRIHKKSIEVLNQHASEIIHKKRLQLTAGSPNEHKEQIHKKIFVDTLLEAAEEAEWTDKMIIDEINTIIFGGYDTVASSLSFTFYCLAENPNVQDEVYKELLEIFGEDQRCPTHNDLQKMKYLEQVIKESLRLYPSGGFLARKVSQDFPIGDGKYIPKGVNTVISILTIHRNPKFWPNPEQFDPQRFTPEAAQSRNPFAFLPFSIGPRNCLGQKYAMLEMKVTVSKVLRRFEILSCPDPEDKPKLRAGIILTSQNGVKVRLKPRKS